MLDLSSAEPEEGAEGCCYLVVKQQLLLRREHGRWQLPKVPLARLQAEPECFYLGRLAGQPCYVSLSLFPELLAAEETETLPLRQLLGQLNDDEFAMASRALQFVSWQHNHRFCSRCGAPTQRLAGELAMHCRRCDYRQYPRISPCIITLVVKGEYALLGRSPRFPAGMFSCLAGFIEAGESAEQAVHREVFEEAGIRIGDLQYSDSQSWPFPHSLMLGFFARYQSGELQCLDEELEDVGWFHYQHLPQLPALGSIARSLIEQWRQRCAVEKGK